MAMDYKKLASEAAKSDKALAKEMLESDKGQQAEAMPEKKKEPRKTIRKTPSAEAGEKKASFEVVAPANDKLTAHMTLLTTPEIKDNLDKMVKEKGFRSKNAALNAILQAYFAN